jgi:hypothetical protein
VPVMHRNYFFKSPMYMAFPTAVDPADRAVGPLSPLPCHAWHGYGVTCAHHGEVRRCRRACERTPLRDRRRCAAGGRLVRNMYWHRQMYHNMIIKTNQQPSVQTIITRPEREILVPVMHRNYFFKSPMYMACPTAVDHADRAVGPLSPLPCQAWHGYGVTCAHQGEVRGCRRACERTPLRGRCRCAAGGSSSPICTGIAKYIIIKTTIRAKHYPPPPPIESLPVVPRFGKATTL